MSRSGRDPEAILKRLEWTVIRRLDGLLQGNYRTLFRGFGLDLADLREYQASDDVRHIDWNVTARLDTPYVREYNEDREITAWFLLDLSPSMDFGSSLRRKRSMLIEFVTVMARLLTRHGNRTGALLFGGDTEQVIPARGGRLHVLHLLDRLLAQPELTGSPPTNLMSLLERAWQVMPRRSLVFVVSDFFSAPGWAGPLGRLAERHEMLAVRIFDPLELELPDLGMVVMQDAETGEQLSVDTGDRGFRSRFIAEARRHEEELRAALAGAGVDTLELSTEDDFVDSIMRFADLRRQRSMLLSGTQPVQQSRRRSP